MKLIICLFMSSLAFGAKNEFNQKEKSIAAWKKASVVFNHPRCMNCHPAGDRPTQGNDLHLHTMNVKRGVDDHGSIALQCSACHQTENNPSSEVPGAPGWKLAPKKMAWQGLSESQLCRRLRDPKSTGMTTEEFIKHNAEDDLVAWGWNPGGKREPVPGTQKEFGEAVAEWMNTGAHCPE